MLCPACAEKTLPCVPNRGARDTKGGLENLAAPDRCVDAKLGSPSCDLARLPPAPRDATDDDLRRKDVTSDMVLVFSSRNVI